MIGVLMAGGGAGWQVVGGGGERKTVKACIISRCPKMCAQ